MAPSLLPRAARAARPAVIGVGLLCSSLALLVAGPAGGASPPAKATSQVYFVQGVTGGAADVTVDGQQVTAGLDAAAVFGPVDLTAGKHTVAFAGDGWDAESSVDIRNPSEDVVVHLPADAGAAPTVTVFENDTAPVREGEGRLTVAHTAVVPPADIVAGGQVLFANVANGEFASAEVPTDTYEVEVVPTGETDPLLGPLDLDVAAAALTRVFAIGEPTDGSMTAVVQVIPLGETSGTAPSTVGAGEAGLATPDEDRAPSVWLAPLLAVLMGASFVAWNRRRHVRG